MDLHHAHDLYLAGKYQEVTDALTVCGPAVYDDPLVLEQARLVANEIAQRVRHNLELFVGRLNKLDYRWKYEDQVPIEPLSAKKQAMLVAAQTRFGPLPIMLQAFYEHIGEVDFCGCHPLLSKSNPDQRFPLGDPLVIWCDENELEIIEDYIADENVVPSTEDPYAWTISTEACLKAGYSATTVDVLFPIWCFDSPTFYDTSLVDYLRVSCTYGGFAGLEYEDLSPKAQAAVAMLTAGCLSF